MANSKLKRGDRIQDNDPRVGTRILVIQGWVGPDVVSACNEVGAGSGNGRVVKIRVDRIHTDGKTRRSGFRLLPR